MPTQTTDLFLLEDLEDAGKTSELAESDLDALHAVADWIKSYVVKPHKDLGRAGPVCPFVPGALDRKTFWLAPEQIADRDVPAVVELMNGYRRLFLDARPTDGDDAKYKVIVVVFTDLPADRAPGVFDSVLEQLAVPSYAEDGILYGPFYEGHEGTAIYNSGFRPFRSPVPFLFVRHGVVSDWKFFLDKEDWLSLWARRFGESGVHALAEEHAACRGAWGTTNPRCDRLLRGSATTAHGQRGRHGTWGERRGRFPCGDPIDARLRDAQIAVADSAGLEVLTKGVGAKPQHKRAP
jgi:hypothetical protein